MLYVSEFLQATCWLDYRPDTQIKSTFHLLRIKLKPANFGWQKLWISIGEMRFLAISFACASFSYKQQLQVKVTYRL
jgi:hypothetical protein